MTLGVVGGAGTLLRGALADRLGKASPAWRLKLVAVVLLLMAPAWAAAFLSGNAAAMVALLVFPEAFLGFYLGPTFAMIQSIVEPHMRATAAALLLFLINVIGLGIGPLAVGVLSDALSSVAGPDSLRFALLATPPLCIWAAYHYYVASRTIGLHLLEGRSA